MKEQDHLILIFSGSEVAVIMLKAQLEENGIAAMIRNDFQSGVAAGFVAGFPSFIDLYVRESDQAMAEPIVRAFEEINR